MAGAACMREAGAGCGLSGKGCARLQTCSHLRRRWCSSTYSGKSLQKVGERRLCPSDAAASRRFSAAVVAMLPVVWLLSFMKLSRPFRMVPTDQRGFPAAATSHTTGGVSVLHYSRMPCWQERIWGVACVMRHGWQSSVWVPGSTKAAHACQDLAEQLHDEEKRRGGRTALHVEVAHAQAELLLDRKAPAGRQHDNAGRAVWVLGWKGDLPVRTQVARNGYMMLHSTSRNSSRQLWWATHP